MNILSLGLHNSPKSRPLAVLCAELGGCQAGNGFEMVAEIAAVAIATGINDSADGQVCLGKLLFGFCQPASLQVTHDGNAGDLLESVGQVGGA